MNPTKKPKLSDGTDINYRTLLRFVQDAKIALREVDEENAAHYFEMFETYLKEDVMNNKRPLAFTYKALGL
jgi:agmatine/peptidylarginine deiminase